MFLMNVVGARIISLPDGTIRSRTDLPPERTERWVASRKAKVVQAVKHGLLTRDEAMKRYRLSGDELDSWARAVERFGEEALKTTCLQRYRQL